LKEFKAFDEWRLKQNSMTSQNRVSDNSGSFGGSFRDHINNVREKRNSFMSSESFKEPDLPFSLKQKSPVFKLESNSSGSGGTIKMSSGSSSGDQQIQNPNPVQ
jgi:hypothetical protein